MLLSIVSGMVYYGCLFVALCIILWLVALLVIRLFAAYKRHQMGVSAKTVAFLHPYCGGGGGGERVLWDAIAVMMEQRDKLKFHRIVIYSANHEKHTLPKVLKNIATQFNITISQENRTYLSLIPLTSYWVVEPERYPRATLILQSLAAAILALEGLFKCPAHIFIDTTGFAFTYPIAWILFGCTVISYTHYPTISNDMLQRVTDGKVMYNNTAQYANNTRRKQLKLYYYKLFAMLYGMAGYFADIVMVNSTWTYNHIRCVFFRSDSSVLRIVYPPCGNTEHLQQFKLEKRKKIILSVGQFRPEKNHTLQVEAFHEFRKKCKSKHGDVMLYLVGSVRGIEDRKRVTKLLALISKYNLKNHVAIKVKLEWSSLLKLYKEAFVGLHTMEDEHFGICLAECMSAGLVTIGHCSGGPLSDIVANIKHKEDVDNRRLQTERGFLCTTVEQYAACFETVFDQYQDGNGWLTLRKNARKHCVQRFSSSTFQRQFVNTIQSALL